MVLLWDVLLFCLGIGLLVKGSDWLVDAAARIAKQFGVSNFIIGLTIVAIGTSLPELGAAVTASFYGNSELVLGDIVGSNIANIALIVGLAGAFIPIGLKRDLYKRDGAIMLFSTGLFFLFCANGMLSRAEGGVMLFLFFAYILYFLTTKRVYKKEFHFQQYLQDYIELKKRERFEKAPRLFADIERAFSDHLNKGISTAKKIWLDFRVAVKKNKVAIYYLSRQLLIVLAGTACLFFGANFVVDAASRFPISQLAIGLVFVAIGTSLPELSVTISSLRKGIPQIMIGNLIGSNIANILWVGGMAAIVSPVIVPFSTVMVDFVFLLIIAWMFIVFLRNDRKITRIESLTLLMLYLAFVAMAFGVKLGA